MPKKGHMIWIYCKGKVIEWDDQDKPVRMVGTHSDITELKNAQQKIISSEKFLHLIMQNNPDLLFVKDRNFKIVKANESFLRLYPEKQRDKIIGYTTLESYKKKERDEFLKMDKEAFKTGKSETIEEINFPDGEKKILFTKKVRFQNEHDEEFILGIGRDVTEREKLITALTKSNTDLERFAYIASHDLQEPLRMVRNYADILGKRLAGQLAEREQRMFTFLESGAAHMQELVSDILEYSKLGDEEQKIVQFDLADIFAKVLQNLASEIKSKNAKITLHNSLKLVGNEMRFMRLLQNLLCNSLKYQQQEQNPLIDIKSEIYNEDYYLFTIADNGIGINKKYLVQIFEPFKRLHNRYEYSGTGIGLAICKKIIEAEGGEIWAESREGKGTKIFFTYPKLETYSI